MKSIVEFQKEYQNELEGNIRFVADQLYSFKQLRTDFVERESDELIIRWGSVEAAEKWFCEKKNEYKALQGIYETLYGTTYDFLCSF